MLTPLLGFHVEVELTCLEAYPTLSGVAGPQLLQVTVGPNPVRIHWQQFPVRVHLQPVAQQSLNAENFMYERAYRILRVLLHQIQSPL